MQDHIPEISLATYENLWSLADKLVTRNESKATLVIPIIGAGASTAAKIPTAEELKTLIYQNLTQSSYNRNDNIKSLLDQEAVYYFGKKARDGILRLSLFEFASIISKFAYGRNCIHREVNERIKKAPVKKPLCYELLAHLAKHHYIDHFISLNFDELLDSSLEDEIPNRLRIIAGADDLPGSNFRDRDKDRNNICYLMKPFGSLRKDRYKLTPEDVMQFGDDSLWQFCIDNIFRLRFGNCYPDVTIVLVGYAANEEAFEHLILKLKENQRQIDLYVIKKGDALGDRLEYLQNRCDIKFKPIVLDAELALLFLSQIIQKTQHRNNRKHPSVSISRHEILSNCVDYVDATEPDSRFEIEVILQAVKSRGFFTIESIGDVQRIRSYANNAYEVIRKMLDTGLLRLNNFTNDEKHRVSCADESRWCQDFNLHISDPGELAEELLKKWRRSSGQMITEWCVSLDTKTAIPTPTTLKNYLSTRLDKIGSGVEVEISGKPDASSRWLFRVPEDIDSIAKLGNITNTMFEKYMDYTGGQLEIYGVWSTGEWLFHEKGYAFELFGKRILSRLQVGGIVLQVVTSDPQKGNNISIRNERSEAVNRKLREYDTADVESTSWWRLNRRLTLLRYTVNGDPIHQEGIYFRRRISTPLISPIHLTDPSDCQILYKMFCHYWRKTV